MEEEPRTRGRAFFKAAKFSSVGLEFGLAIAIGWGIGYWLDGKFGTSPWLMILFLLFGAAAGFKGLFDAAREATRAAAESKERDADAPHDAPDAPKDARDDAPTKRN